MTHILSWHSTRAADRAVYHDNTRCPEGDAIELKHRCPGPGGRPRCEHCARYSRQELGDLPPANPPMPSRGPVRPGTDEPKCPDCRSHQIVTVAYMIVARGMIKEAHRCEVCRTTFFLNRPAIG